MCPFPRGPHATWTTCRSAAFFFPLFSFPRLRLRRRAGARNARGGWGEKKKNKVKKPFRTGLRTHSPSPSTPTTHALPPLPLSRSPPRRRNPSSDEGRRGRSRAAASRICVAASSHIEFSTINMGANCCIAAKERSQPHVASAEVSAYRIRHSPSWSFRWDNRTHIEDMMENSMLFSNQSSGNIQQELKSGSIAPTEGHPYDDNLSDLSCSVKSKKPESKMEPTKYLKADSQAVQSTSSTSTIEASSLRSPSAVIVASGIKMSESLPSTPPQLPSADPSSSRSRSLNVDANSMRKAHRSPGHQLCRQILDSKVHSFKSFNESYSAEGRPSSSMPSAYSKDLIAGGSQGESSQRWSTCRFSESMASSQRERWSVDSDLFGHVTTNRTRSNASHSTSLAPGQEVCKLCSKQLKERSTWNAHELAIIAVLFCGHSYHANCLDSITAESEKYDPPCPVCTHGEKHFTNLYGKQDLKTKNKVSKSVITDTDIDRSSKHRHKSSSMKEPRLDTSSSMKDSFSRPFLKRHFSIGSRPPRSVLRSGSTGRKGFWKRQWRE
uniref:RING-type domain-containing protein n=1 Tax=Oryza punctata TaxID=4537 RepID=A0A0E0JGN2_ORYPU